MNKYIKSIINTRGWQEIEKMFNATIEDNKKINQDLDDHTLAREYRASEVANGKITNLLNRIKLSGGIDAKDKISYK